MQLFGNSEQLILIEKAAIIVVYGDKRMDYVMLKDVCAINMGQSPDSNSYNDEGQGVPFFQGNADFGERYPVTRKWCSAPTKMAMPDDILISVRAPIGAMNYAKEECCIGRGLAALTPDKSKVSPQFIFWLLKGKNQELNSKGTGSTFKAIGRKVLEETLVPNVPLEKQVKYSAILEKVYAIIQSRNAQLQKLDELVKARFVEMFGDPQCNPCGYKHTKLSDIATYYNGLTYKPENVAEEGTIVLRSSNIQNSQLDFADTVRVDCAIKERLMVQKNDILMCSRNGSAKLVGKVALIKDIQEPMSFGAFMMIIRSHYFGYLMTYFQMDAFRQQIKTGATTTINQITGRMLDDVTIPLPPMALVDQFAAFVEQTDKTKVAVQKALDEAQLLFDSLMQTYFDE